MRCLPGLMAIAWLTVAPCFPQNNVMYTKKAAAYNCNTDPMSDSWNHIALILNWDRTGSTSMPYTITGTDFTRGTATQATTGSPSVIGSAYKKNGVKGFGMFSQIQPFNVQADGIGNVTAFKNGFRVGQWCQTNGSESANDQFCIELLGSDTTASYTDSWELELRGDAAGGWDARFQCRQAGGTKVACSATNKIIEDQWHFVELAFSDSGNWCRGYIDGVQICSVTANGMSDNVNDIKTGWGLTMNADDLWISWNENFNIYNHVVANGCYQKPTSL